MNGTQQINRNPANYFSLKITIFLSVVFAAALTHLHLQIVDYHYYDMQFPWYDNIVNNNGPYPDQYRILTYYIAHQLIKAGIPFTIAFAGLRFIFTALCLFIFIRYLENWVKPISVLLGFFILVSVLPFTYLFYGMQPTDPLNMLIYFLVFFSFLHKKYFMMFPLIIIGMVNRETVILIPLIYACLQFGAVPFRKWLPQFLTSSIIVLGIYFGLRWFFGLKEPYAPTSPFHYWKVNLTDWKTWVQLFGFFNISVLIVWYKWKEKPEFLKRISLILPIFILIHFTQGYMREVRYFLPILPIIIPLTLINLELKFKQFYQT
ncbi:hypothetical protein ACWM35_23055 [Neobacillus sp. K501]